ncbi:MAG: hypothetical protein GQ477_05725 [Nanohaloarchaea archaeon]|nr:hypothetical protein [Candidatus Nanohaloarchaea archaeon]
MIKKGFGMSINVIVSLVVLLVLVSISITIIGNDAATFSSTSETRIDAGSSVTLCQIACFKCCRHSESPADICGTFGDAVFGTDGCFCPCSSSLF